MASIIIDTSSWIDLAKPKFSNILEKLEEYKEQGLLELLTNDIIVAEWYRNKEATITNIEQSIKSHAKSARKIVEFLEEPDKTNFENILNNYKSKETIELDIANSHIERVEKLLNSSTITLIDDKLKIVMANRAIEKLAPFHNSKNNMADALIIFSAINWVNEFKLFQTSLMFISANHKEFAAKNDPGKIHPDIEANSQNADLIFTNDIGRLIEVKEEYIFDEETFAEVQLWNHLYEQAEIARGK